MVGPDLGDVVVEIIYKAGPETGIRAVVAGGKTGDLNAGQLGRIQLGLRVQVGIVDSVRGPVACRTAGGVRDNGALPIGVCRDGEIIYQGRREGRGEVYDSSSVGPRPK